jgi:hypothetical protein
MKTCITGILCGLTLMLVGCASAPKYDYAAFKKADPKSILVLPPKNSSPDIKATYSFYSHTQRPLSESGFYVLPITVVDEIFKANGVTLADDMHQVNPKRLMEIFGADAALYIDIKEYGTKYFVVGSAAIVTAEARLIDLRSGDLLWQGKATASSEESNNNQQSGGLAELLVTALIKQVVGSTFDQSHEVGKITNLRLLSAGTPNGLLYGPKSPQYQK